MRPFFLTFQSLLFQKIPPEELDQAGEEALWEYACLTPAAEPGRPAGVGTLVRLASICLRYYRLMLRAGLGPAEAVDAVADACLHLDGWLQAAAAQPKCSLAGYFASKHAPVLGAAAFCRSCPKRDSGCADRDRLLTLAGTLRHAAARTDDPASIPADGALAPA